MILRFPDKTFFWRGSKIIRESTANQRILKKKITATYHSCGYSLAEMERFELSIPLWGIHDFQSCALDQLRDISTSARLTHYNLSDS